MTGSLTTEADKEAYAQDFRRVLTDLGPCFIKFGQMLSIRPDVLPPVLVKELQKLCDNVPAYATSRALDLIEEQLGPGSVGELFEGLDKSSHPIAAASLGQVYKATLKMTGETVAIKVQRPDMVRAVLLDLYLLRKYAFAVEYVKGKLMQAGLLAHRKSYDVDLVDTFSGATYLELDYENEAANQSLIAERLVHRIGADKNAYTPSSYVLAQGIGFRVHRRRSPCKIPSRCDQETHSCGC